MEEKIYTKYNKQETYAKLNHNKEDDINPKEKIIRSMKIKNELLPEAEFLSTKENKDVFVLEKEFDLSSLPNSAVINATALGIYFIKINDKRVGDARLAPGWTSYKKMLQVQEYDVKEYLLTGHNKIEFIINRGWYSGRLAGGKFIYGEYHAGALELQMDTTKIFTDDTWKAYTYIIQESSIYDGETIDFNYQKTELTINKVDYDKGNLIRQMTEPVKVTEILEVKEKFTTPKGSICYDFGQNMAGVVQVTIPENFTGDLELKFAEIIIDNEFYTENLRSAKATDTYLSPRGTIVPEFTFHGFRYLKSSVDLPESCFKALAMHTDMIRTGEIHTGHKKLNRLMENVTWGQRSNFVDIPTDCPQRDERLGWTGDINVFCRTAAFNYDIRKIMKKWLQCLRHDQNSKGEIVHVIPECKVSGTEPSAIWTDCVCMIPWTLYEMYDDISFLEENIDAMIKYIGAVETKMKDGLIVEGQVYGDWLALDNEVALKDESSGRTDKLFLGNVFYVADCRIIEKIYRVFGDVTNARKYKKKWETTVLRIREEYCNNYGEFMIDTITAQALYLYFNIVPEENKQKLADILAENVRKHNCVVTTGFIGTAFLLYALAENNHFPEAAKLLMNENYPGWIYEVNMEATTTWERWSSLMPDGKPDSKGMNSYNHYAYGAVKEFVYTQVCGIVMIEPGFKKYRLSPHKISDLYDIHAKFQSVYGLIESGYNIKGDEITYEFRIPEGTEATIVLPENNNSEFTVKGEGKLIKFKYKI